MALGGLQWERRDGGVNDDNNIDDGDDENN